MAKLSGVGVGPGDPELLTWKAWQRIQQADVISYISNADGQSQAKTIARLALAERGANSDVEALLEAPVTMPMCTDRQVANAVYDAAAAELAEHLAQGRRVVFLCEGDPLFFGSFTYILDRLQSDAYELEVIPGITSVQAASSRLQRALTLLQESCVIASGRHSEAQLVQMLEHHDSVIIMKAGKQRGRILAALERSGRTADAAYLEYIGREQERVVLDVSALEATTGPYFSLFVVTRDAAQRARMKV